MEIGTAHEAGEPATSGVTRLALQHRRKLILYDTFRTPTNAEVIRWMGEEVRRAGVGNARVGPPSVPHYPL